MAHPDMENKKTPLNWFTQLTDSLSQQEISMNKLIFEIQGKEMKNKLMV